MNMIIIVHDNQLNQSKLYLDFQHDNEMTNLCHLQSTNHQNYFDLEYDINEMAKVDKPI